MAFLGFGFNAYGPFQEKTELFLAENVTLIIGKNNTGKSCAIDFLCRVLDSNLGRTHAAMPEMIDLHFALEEADLRQVFPEFKEGEGIVTRTQCSSVDKYVGQHFVVRYEHPTSVQSWDACNDTSVFDMQYKDHWGGLTNQLFHEFIRYKDNTHVRRLLAERDILPEADTASEITLTSRGEGASLLVHRYINQSTKDETIIEEQLLRSLNEVMAPDAIFESIRVQLLKQVGGDKWEIFLREQGGQRFPLSATGSGLKTVILVLLNLIVFGGSKRDDSIFLFEELENNLHPSLQRRLFEYLYNYSKNKRARIVLTSHSQVAINTFFARQNALVHHAFKNGDGIASLQQVTSTDEGRETLADLGVRASDLFQTNGIIWVEGPSDRIYIKAWLEALFDNEIVEGIHYQFLYYGGRLLSHYTAEETASKINVMFTNRNSAIVIDSDRRNDSSEINATKRRVRKEFNTRGLFYWITAGKEIENYLSVRCLQQTFGDRAPKKQIGAFEIFPAYIEKTAPRFSDCKVDFAKKVAENIVVEDLDVLDLHKKIDALYQAIRSWNS